MARDILSGAASQIFRDGWAGMPVMAFVPASISLRLFGNTLFGLQMTSVVGGVVCLAAFYLMTLQLFKRQRIALISTALLAINIPFIHFSRIAEYIDPWTFILPGLYLTFKGIRSRQSLFFALAGILVGFGIQMYYSSRVVLVILGALFLFLLVFERRWMRENWPGFVWLGLGILVTLGPTLIFFGQHLDILNGRSRDVWLFSPDVMRHLMGKYQVSSVGGVVLEQFRRSVLMFNHAIDSSTQFGFPHPMFDSLVAPLITVGVAAAIKNWRRWEMAFLLFWVAATMVLGSMLTVDAPAWPRLVGIIPVAALFAGLGIDRLIRWIGQWPLQPPKALVNSMVIIALIFLGWKGWGEYYRTVENNARPQARIGRYLNSLPADITACSFLDPYELNVRETAFLAWPRKLIDIKAAGMDTDLSACPQSSVVWILSNNHLDQLERIQVWYPNGIFTDHLDQTNKIVFSSYLIAD
jgi:4-amino-4-deoxy-L-arabinose transferase-like glycosyltransferase